VPYILAIGMWALALGSAFTLWQRMRAVYLDATAKAAAAAQETVAQQKAAGTEEI